jgi:hypothetical protein
MLCGGSNRVTAGGPHSDHVARVLAFHRPHDASGGYRRICREAGLRFQDRQLKPARHHRLQRHISRAVNPRHRLHLDIPAGIRPLIREKHDTFRETQRVAQQRQILPLRAVHDHVEQQPRIRVTFPEPPESDDLLGERLAEPGPVRLVEQHHERVLADPGRGAERSPVRRGLEQAGRDAVRDVPGLIAGAAERVLPPPGHRQRPRPRLVEERPQFLPQRPVIDRTAGVDGGPAHRVHHLEQAG